MFRHLQIPYRAERWLVGLADVALRVLMFLTAPLRSASTVAGPPKRILLLRLERVGDLVMVLDAIAMIRTLAPHAHIDLVVGSWNVSLARLISCVNAIETLDVPWMAPAGSKRPWSTLLRHAKAWRSRGYDLAINFEPDIRSNLLVALCGAPRRAGFNSGGGGALLTAALAPHPEAHISANARALVARAFAQTGLEAGAFSGTDRTEGPTRVAQAFRPVLMIPDDARRQAADLIGQLSPGGVTIGIQPAARIRIKEWDPTRFAEVGAELARSRGAKVVLIGSAGDRPALDAVRAAWPRGVPRIDLPVETDLVVLAAVLERLALFISGDTGPMHLACAVGTRVLAVFGPSLHTRYAPLSSDSRIVRIDIPCSPCNLLRKPPERCVGHVPDCLSGIESAQVLRAAHEMLGT